jgi:RHS repeat-associated protein
VTIAPGRAAGDRRYRGTVIEQAGAVRYRHDTLGRRTASEFAGGVRAYVWNAEDRLVGVTNPDGTRWRYRYDALGRRVDKSRLAEDGTVVERTEFSWSEELLVEQVHIAADGTRHVTTWDYHPADGTVVTQVERLLPAGSDNAAGVRWYTVLTDQVGSPTEMFTPTGELVWQRRPTLWGLADRTAGVDIPLRFPGQYHDAETGLHYNYQRYYDPETASFVSPDPFGLTAAPTAVSYVPNPLHWIDPLGLAPDCAPSGNGQGGKGNGPGKNNGKGGIGKYLGNKVKKVKNALTRPSRTSTRIQQAPSRLDDQTVWHSDFGPHSTFGGGTSAHVQLGPNAQRPGGYGSTPGDGENTAVNGLNAANTAGGHTGRPEWIKGHIINDNLGGPGQSHNLTPLTQDANSSHLHNVETPIKNALTTAGQVGRYNQTATHWYGVDFNTTVHHSGPINTNDPHSAVADHIDVSSHYIRKPKVGDGPIEAVPPGGLPARPPANPWPALPNGRLDPSTGAWTPHNAPGPVPGPSTAVPGPSTTHANDDAMSSTSTLTPPPSEVGDPMDTS